MQMPLVQDYLPANSHGNGSTYVSMYLQDSSMTELEDTHGCSLAGTSALEAYSTTVSVLQPTCHRSAHIFSVACMGHQVELLSRAMLVCASSHTLEET